MSTKVELHPFRDLTFFVSTIMAFLFCVGFIYETVYLEEFKLNNSELAPDASTAIVYGFRYAFLNGYSAILSISMYGLLSFIFFASLKSDFVSFIESNEFIKNHLNGLNGFFQREVSPIPFILGLIFLCALILLHSISEGKKLANRIKEEKRIECITISSGSVSKEIEGNIIRIRDGLLVFWEKDKDKTYLIPQRKMVELSYESCPNKAKQ